MFAGGIPEPEAYVIPIEYFDSEQWESITGNKPSLGTTTDDLQKLVDIPTDQLFAEYVYQVKDVPGYSSLSDFFGDISKFNMSREENKCPTDNLGDISVVSTNLVVFIIY